MVAAVAAKVLLAVQWGLLADEAYYWVWSTRLAFGYFDHPPGIAWLVAATTALGGGELAVRAGPILCGVVAWLALRGLTPRPALLAAVWATPMLFGLTLFATPDAPLLAAWAVALWGAARGGRGWLVAGAAAGVAMLCKLTGFLALPLLLLAAGRREMKTPWPWWGAGMALAIALPNLAWNLEHGWVTWSWQLGHGLGAEVAPGAAGAIRFLRDQSLVANPLLAVATLAWVVISARSVWFDWTHAGPMDLDEARVRRLAWFTVVGPLLVLGWAATRAPGEANWAAPAWVGASVGITLLPGRWPRVVWAGAALGWITVALAAVHARSPLVSLERDPAIRVAEGPALAAAVRAVLPEEDQRVRLEATRPLYTERYQEAALIHFYARIPAHRHPRCGRPDQYDLWATPVAEAGWLLRPARSGPTLCGGAVEAAGAPLPGMRGRWEIFPLGPTP
ncbi:MAG: glycosyltransferase family 39 protein [Deltaproteobacteria bacterium]|nr:glycosyltransferase family 39 protein [Deltaproteobacteria bacterium]